MGDLIGKNINETYQGLLKTDSNSALVGDKITDGLGNESALFLGKTGNGSTFDGSLTTKQNLLACNNIVGKNNLTIGGVSNLNGKLNVAGDTIVSGITGTSFKLSGGGVFSGGITFNNSIQVVGTAALGSTTVTGNVVATGNLTVGGAISAAGDIIAFHSSDSRLKDNLIPIDSKNYVDNLTGFEFDWNERSKRSGKGKGIIAQDLYKIDKTLVHESNEGYLSVDYISLIPVLIEEIKRLGNEIEELKNKN